MKIKLFMTFVAALFAATFASCSKDDGDWDPMKWRTDVKTASDGYVEVPAEGGTYVFKCKNYSGFWICDALETVGADERFFDDQGGNVTTTWATISAADGKLTVSIEPNTTASSRLLNVTVTAGDIFDYFKFRQAASSK